MSSSGCLGIPGLGLRDGMKAPLPERPNRKPMQIYRIDPLQDPRWCKLLETHRRASVFHTAGWLNSLRRTYGYKPVAFSTSPPIGELKNGLVFCRVCSRVTGYRMVSLPFSDHCEPLFDCQQELDFIVCFLQGDLEHEDCKYLEVHPES